MRSILIAILLILGVPASADVGDVYFCNTTGTVYFDQKKQKVLVDKKSRAFKFQWVEKYGGEQRAEFDEKFIISNKSITIESGGESSFRGVESYTSGLLWFDEPRLKWTYFAWNEEFSDHTVWASCSKF